MAGLAGLQDEYMIEAFELVALFCELLSTRLQLIVEARHCPRDMKEGAGPPRYAFWVFL